MDDRLIICPVKRKFYKMRQQIIDGRTDLVIDYIMAGNDVNEIVSGGRSLISHCAYYGDVTAIKHLIDHGASLDDLGQNYDLNGAAFHGHWQLCQYLIEQGADANFADSATNETALHNCIKPNSPASSIIIKLLLHHGADPNIKTNPGIETGGFMRDARTKGETALHRAAAFGNEDAICLLIDAGADIRARDAYGDSPMSWASWHLRPGKILAMLTFDEYQIHPLHVKRIQKDHGFGFSSGMEINLLGKVHLK